MPRLSRRLRETFAWALVAVFSGTVVAVYAGVIQGGPLDPPAPPSATDGVKLPGTPISSLPITISQPGHYYLRRDLSLPAPGNGILVLADDVDIDLNGFTLRGNPNGIAILVDDPHTRFRVRNGTITGWLAAVSQPAAPAAQEILIEDLTITDSLAGGMFLQENATVRRVTVNRSGGPAIGAGPNSTVEHAVVRAALNFGIDAGANSAVRDCEVSFVNGGAAGQAAVRVGDHSTVERCVVRSNQSAGIRGGAGTLVVNSVASFNSAGDAIGINVGASSTVLYSTARANGSTGISTGNFSVVEDSVALLNGASGVAVGARAIVRGSVADANGLDGIAASTSAGTLIEGNVVTRNNNDGIEAGTGVRILNNTLRGNADATAGFADGAAINLTSTVAFVEGNVMTGNDVGILSASGNSTIVRNVARDNPGGNYTLQADDLNGVFITLANVGTDTHSHYNYAP